MQNYYVSSDIAERIRFVAKSKGITLTTMFGEIELGRNTMANLKTSVPKADNLAKIADYLDCSVDFLLGRKEKYSYSELSENQQKIVNIFKNLDLTQQGEIIGRAQLIAEQNEAECLRKESV